MPASATANSGGPSVVLNAVSPANSFSPTVQLNPSTAYYWETHALGVGEEDGTWSAVQTFATGPLPNGLTIIPIFDSTILNDPNAATIEATINAAISVYRENFSDPITVTITYMEETNGLGNSGWFFQTYAYSDYRAALASHATTADDTNALAHLPLGSANPVNGNAQVTVNIVLARAMGLPNSGPIPGQTDGTVLLNTATMNLSSTTTDPSLYSLFATVCHETDEAMGFGSVLNGMTNGEAAPTGPVQPERIFSLPTAAAAAA